MAAFQLSQSIAGLRHMPSPPSRPGPLTHRPLQLPPLTAKWTGIPKRAHLCRSETSRRAKTPRAALARICRYHPLPRPTFISARHGQLAAHDELCPTRPRRSSQLTAIPETESDHHRGVPGVARLDLVEPPAAPATTSSSCATTTATARDEDEEDGFTFAAVAVAAPRLQDADCAFPDARIGGPVYPVFGRPRRSLSLPKQQQQQQQQDEEEEGPGAAGTATVRVPLGRLLVEEPWCDYADAELDGVPAEIYCLWSPGVSPPAPAGSSRRASPARCRKSGSRGDGKSSSTSFLPCKQDLVELVASVVTCGRSCYLF